MEDERRDQGSAADRVRRRKLEENAHRAAAAFHERVAALYARLARGLSTEANAERRQAKRDRELADELSKDRQRSP